MHPEGFHPEFTPKPVEGVELPKRPPLDAAKAALLVAAISLTECRAPAVPEQQWVDTDVTGEAQENEPKQAEANAHHMEFTVDEVMKMEAEEAAKRKEKKEKPLPPIRLQNTVLGRDFYMHMKYMEEHYKPWLPKDKSADAQWKWEKNARLMWNNIVDHESAYLAKHKYHAKNLNDPHVQHEFKQWLASDVGKEAVKLVNGHTDGAEGHPGPEYRNMILGLIMIESSGNPNEVTKKSGATGLTQAMPDVAADDARVIESAEDWEKLKDPAVNLEYFMCLFWKMYHENRNFGFATTVGYNEGEGNLKHQLTLLARKELHLKDVDMKTAVQDVLPRITPIRLYNFMRDNKFRSLKHPDRPPKSFFSSAQYMFHVAILEDYFDKHFPYKKEQKFTPSKVTPKMIAESVKPKSTKHKAHKPSKKPTVAQLPHQRFGHR